MTGNLSDLEEQLEEMLGEESSVERKEIYELMLLILDLKKQKEENKN